MANQKIIERKQNTVEEIKGKINDSSSFVLFEYQGLTVNDTMELRRKLRESDSEYKVYKNTLVRRALEGLNIDMSSELEGPKAVVFGKDAIAPIKILSDFAKKHPALEMKIGYVDGDVVDSKELNELAQIPSREGLLTMLAGGLIGVVKDLSISLNLYAEELEK